MTRIDRELWDRFGSVPRIPHATRPDRLRVKKASVGHADRHGVVTTVALARCRPLSDFSCGLRPPPRVDIMLASKSWVRPASRAAVFASAGAVCFFAARLAFPGEWRDCLPQEARPFESITSNTLTLPPVRVGFGPSTVDLGASDDGDNLRVTVEVTNNTTESCTIQAIRTSCSCVSKGTLSLPIIIAPGQLIDLQLAIQILGESGFVSKQITATDDHGNTVFEMNLQSNVSPALVIDPATCILDRAAADRSRNFTLNLRAGSKPLRNLELVGHSIYSGHVSTTLPRRLAAGEVREFQISLSPGLTPEEMRKITLIVWDDNRPLCQFLVVTPPESKH